MDNQIFWLIIIVVFIFWKIGKPFFRLIWGNYLLNKNQGPFHIHNPKTGEIFTKDEYEKTKIEYNEQLKKDLKRIEEFENLSVTEKKKIELKKLDPSFFEPKSRFYEYVKGHLTEDKDEKIEIFKRDLYKMYFWVIISKNSELTELTETWDSLEKGFSKDKVISILGEPSKIREREYETSRNEFWTYKYKDYIWGEIRFDKDNKLMYFHNPNI